MATRRLNIQPLTSYDQQVQNFLGRLRLYRVWRVSANPRAIQQGTLYKSQLDGLKTIMDNLYAESRLLIRTIRNTKGSFNPIYPIPMIDALDPFGADTWLPAQELLHVKTSSYHAKSCQATIGVLKHPPAGFFPLLPPGGKPIKPPRPRPWPPWPPLPPPPGPPNVWVPEMEKTYSTSYAYYWLFRQLYSGPPFDVFDFRNFSNDCVTYWQLFWQLFRHVNTNENTCRSYAINVLNQLEAALC